MRYTEYQVEVRSEPMGASAKIGNRLFSGHYRTLEERKTAIRELHRDFPGSAVYSRTVIVEVIEQWAHVK